MSGGRRPSATIHLPECRDRMLEELRGGATRTDAAESIGCIAKTAQRYISAHPDFAAKVEAAERGENTVPESPPAGVLAPMLAARVVHEAEPVDAAPCDVAKPRVASVGIAELETLRAPLMKSIAEIVDQPDHPHFGRIADTLLKALFGAGMLKQMRIAEREAEQLGEGEKPQRILVIRVPAKAPT